MNIGRWSHPDTEDLDSLETSWKWNMAPGKAIFLYTLSTSMFVGGSVHETHLILLMSPAPRLHHVPGLGIKHLLCELLHGTMLKGPKLNSPA